MAVRQLYISSYMTLGHNNSYHRWDSHGDSDWRLSLKGCDAMWIGILVRPFRRSTLRPSAGQFRKNDYHDNGGIRLLKIVGTCIPNHTEQYRRRLEFSTITVLCLQFHFQYPAAVFTSPMLVFGVSLFLMKHLP
jgi:hypothetical protein